MCLHSHSKYEVKCIKVITSLSIGKNTGIVALEGIMEKTFPKALEDHLLTCTQHTQTHTLN